MWLEVDGGSVNLSLHFPKENMIYDPFSYVDLNLIKNLVNPVAIQENHVALAILRKR